MYLGVKAVIAKSFERIHAANLVNFGIVPLTFAHPEDYQDTDLIEQGDKIEIPDFRAAIEKGAAVTIHNTTKDTQIECKAELSERQRRIVAAGGLLNYTNQSN